MPKIQPLPQGRVGRTLVDKLAPMGARLRQLSTNFGLRPWRVMIYRVTYNGENAGASDFTVNPGYPIELLPTPKVMGFDASHRPADPGGTHEIADLRITKIPFRHGNVGFTEDDLMGHALTQPLTDQEQVYYQLQQDGGEMKGTALSPFPRRFRLVGIPDLKKGRLSWEIQLKKVEQNFIGPVAPT